MIPTVDWGGDGLYKKYRHSHDFLAFSSRWEARRQKAQVSVCPLTCWVQVLQTLWKQDTLSD